MVLRLFCKNQTNFFRFFTNHTFKRSFCTPVLGETNRYKYFLVLDFEATCDKNKKVLQEIIEFPCVKVDVNSLMEISRFHHYVRPVYSPILTNFCVELTGILQEVVDKSNTFLEVYPLFEEWRQKEGLTEENSLYITSGDWDLGHMMKTQCQYSNVEIPKHMTVWADIKKIFGNNKNHFFNSLIDIMNYYNLNFEGKLHSGIDDCLNIVRLIKKMKEDGIEFKPTSKLDSLTLKVCNLNKPLCAVHLNRG